MDALFADPVQHSCTACIQTLFKQSTSNACNISQILERCTSLHQSAKKEALILSELR